MMPYLKLQTLVARVVVAVSAVLIVCIWTIYLFRTENIDSIQPQHINQTKYMDQTQSHLNVSPYIDTRLYIVDDDGPTKYEHVQNEIIHKILWWNEPQWMIDFWDDHLNMSQCSYRNCRLIRDRHQFTDSSAVLFSMSDGRLGERPPVTSRQRNPNQPWIFFSLESPVHHLNEYKRPQWQGVFNWSWTYRTDADIFHPYGILNTKSEVSERNYSEIFKKKTKMVAWLVSHCTTFSAREKYVDILKRFVDVDIFGGCGKFADAHIEDRISSEYKFYLGFENSLCKDYLTEKYFHYYKMDLIDVVRGSGNYRGFLPNRTYINTADFSSIEELGEFLKQLGSNEEEYIDYLKAKDKYEMKDRAFVYKSAMCNICDKLNNLESNRKKYNSIEHWFGRCNYFNDLDKYHLNI